VLGLDLLRKLREAGKRFAQSLYPSRAGCWAIRSVASEQLCTLVHSFVQAASGICSALQVQAESFAAMSGICWKQGVRR
jgi:hypothetical protein